MLASEKLADNLKEMIRVFEGGAVRAVLATLESEIAPMSKMDACLREVLG